MNLKDSLIKHEGLRLKPYKDTKGILTIGIGHNLEDRGISQSVAMTILDEDMQIATLMVRNQYSWLVELDEVRQNVIIELMFVLGPARFSLFKNMINALKVKDYKTAAKELKDSKLCREDISPERSLYLVSRLETGIDLPQSATK